LSKNYLNTLIHELLHACFPEMEEGQVRKASSYITKAIWQQNYRKIAK